MNALPKGERHKDIVLSEVIVLLVIRRRRNEFMN